jgi:putative ABC transport system substrate-binding protein
MNSLHKIVVISTIVIVCSGIFSLPLMRQSVGTTQGVTIGILQTVSHPALDRAREGFIQECTQGMGNRVSFVEQNAEGAMTTAQTIAQSFHRNPKITAIFALGTLATQAISKVEKQKPVIFCAVTDPIALGVVGPSSNVCGVSDVIDVPTSAQILKALCPQAKNVALLFNPAEANSVSLVRKMENTLQYMHIDPLQIGINSEVEIPSAIAIAVRKADVLWIPTDNTIATAMSMVGFLAFKAKKPLFICDNLLVTRGVLASAGGVDYTECGRRSAQLAVKIFKNKHKPVHLGVVWTPSKIIAVHQETCAHLDIHIPNELSSRIVWIK